MAELDELKARQAAMNFVQEMADDFLGLVHSATDGKLGRQSMMDRGMDLFVEAGDANWDRLRVALQAFE